MNGIVYTGVASQFTEEIQQVIDAVAAEEITIDSYTAEIPYFVTSDLRPSQVNPRTFLEGEAIKTIKGAEKRSKTHVPCHVNEVARAAAITNHFFSQKYPDTPEDSAKTFYFYTASRNLNNQSVVTGFAIKYTNTGCIKTMCSYTENGELAVNVYQSDEPQFTQIPSDYVALSYRKRHWWEDDDDDYDDGYIHFYDEIVTANPSFPDELKIWDRFFTNQIAKIADPSTVPEQMTNLIDLRKKQYNRGRMFEYFEIFKDFKFYNIYFKYDELDKIDENFHAVINLAAHDYLTAKNLADQCNYMNTIMIKAIDDCASLQALADKYYKIPELSSFYLQMIELIHTHVKTMKFDGNDSEESKNFILNFQVNEVAQKVNQYMKTKDLATYFHNIEEDRERKNNLIAQYLRDHTPSALVMHHEGENYNSFGSGLVMLLILGVIAVVITYAVLIPITMVGTFLVAPIVITALLLIAQAIEENNTDKASKRHNEYMDQADIALAEDLRITSDQNPLLDGFTIKLGESNLELAVNNGILSPMSESTVIPMPESGATADGITSVAESRINFFPAPQPENTANQEKEHELQGNKTPNSDANG